ncbi:hypothetical protein LTR08_002537 [Meristemomyces frigidus]|nr:hypothetical protein LTR08_002537 [Meristemomyces frigidus]
MRTAILALLIATEGIAAQSIVPQSNTWNSSFALSASQIGDAGIDNVTANNINVAVNFERTNWATGSVNNDSFYTVPSDASSLQPGSILKVEDYTNTSYYTLPPNTALSRIVYQSETLNGSAVPASAFVLWPWMPRRDPRTGKYAVVGWAHGTSGSSGECAPSHIRNLWYQYSAPYILALQGYVVVAPDYTGLGVDRYANGTQIKHPYLSNPSHANDMFYSVEAAQKAWPDELSEQLDLQESALAFPVYYIASALETTFPAFDVSDIFTASGAKLLNLLNQVGGCQSVNSQLSSPGAPMRPNWWQSEYMQLFIALTKNGGQRIAGPMLILQGTADPSVPEPITSVAVNETCALYPQSELEYALFEGVTHVPVLYAGQRVWLDWIADRFAGREAAAPCTRNVHRPAKSVSSYQAEGDYYLELATQAYEVA